MNIFDLLMQMLFQTDQFLSLMSLTFGDWIYVILFLIVFAETGLVMFPFLPGDSLLFALGAMTTLDQGSLSLTTLSVTLFVAALLGDNVNYHVGRYLGAQLFQNENSKLFKIAYLKKAEGFYLRFGAHAIVMARFIPIVRTFVPFVAGVGKMHYPKFLSYSVFGAALWIQIFLWAGHYFGNLPAVKKNFQLVILGVIVLSVMPIFVGWFRLRRSKQISEKPIA